MALKQDYILRMIEELINVLIKTLREEEKDINFNESDTDKLKDENELYLLLKKLVDDKKINEAENYLFENLKEDSKLDFFAGMAFYKYLNTKEELFLEECNYSREEIVEGLADLSKKYGFGDFVEMFMKS